MLDAHLFEKEVFGRSSWVHPWGERVASQAHISSPSPATPPGSPKSSTFDTATPVAAANVAGEDLPRLPGLRHLAEVTRRPAPLQLLPRFLDRMVAGRADLWALNLLRYVSGGSGAQTRMERQSATECGICDCICVRIFAW